MDLWLKINANAIVRTRMCTNARTCSCLHLHHAQKMCGSLNADMLKEHKHARTHIQNGEFESVLSGCSCVVCYHFQLLFTINIEQNTEQFHSTMICLLATVRQQLPYERQHVYDERYIIIYIIQTAK